MATLEEMVPIPIAEFISGVTTPVDLHIKLSDDKFVVILKEGTKTEVEQLKKYKEKSVDYVWVKKGDFLRFSRKTAAIAGILISSDQLDPKKKSIVLSNATSSVFKQFDHMGLSIDVYELAKQVSEATVALCQTHKELNVLFESLKNYGDEQIRHSVAVSILSTLIGEAMGWNNRVTLEKLALGGMLHDIGLKTLPQELVTKPLAVMTSDETELYETHPYRGVQLLRSVGVVPDDVVAIVFEHHENSIGVGYPRRIREVVMHPMAKVVALANHFVDLTMPHMNTPLPKTPREALVYLQDTLGQPYNRDAFKALVKIIDKESTKNTGKKAS
jgi:putative nucleotidyltransferase with HDIG domain